MIRNSTLECSSNGDRRFSAFYAYTNLFGVYDSIENHYQKAKKFNNRTVKNPKGMEPDFIEVNGLKIESIYLTNFYNFLWTKYLDENPDLVMFASKFKNFHDIFRGKNTINCQADAIYKYIKYGPSFIMESPSMIEFLNLINYKHCKIYTSYYDVIDLIPRTYIPIAISLYKPQYILKKQHYTTLSPTDSILSCYKSGKYTKKEYRLEFQKQVLNNLTQEQVFSELMEISKNRVVVLLCYEEPNKFCHRHLVAKWFNEVGISCEELNFS